MGRRDQEGRHQTAMSALRVLSGGATHGLIEAVRARGGVVVAAMNPAMPYTYGDAELSTDHIDFAVEYDAALPSPGVTELDEVSRAIGDRVAERVGDGATLQLGIGAVPDAVLLSLKARRGLRIWSEMFSDGVLELDRAGALDASQPLVSSFLFGSPELYAWVDHNPRVRMLRTETTNEPANIAANPMMTSVNTALEVGAKLVEFLFALGKLLLQLGLGLLGCIGLFENTVGIDKTNTNFLSSYADRGRT